MQHVEKLRNFWNPIIGRGVRSSRTKFPPLPAAQFGNWTSEAFVQARTTANSGCPTVAGFRCSPRPC